MPPSSSPRYPRPAAPPWRPGQQIHHGAPCQRLLQGPLPAASCSVVSSSQQQLSHHGAPDSNKPHPAEKSTPVWLVIWCTWAGFANSQSSPMLPHCLPCRVSRGAANLSPWIASAQTDTNLSAHLHRLPTPPPYLRRMRLSPGPGASIRWVMRLALGRASGVGCWMMLFPAKGADVGWQMMLLVVHGTVPANHRAHESLF